VRVLCVVCKKQEINKRSKLIEAKICTACGGAQAIKTANAISLSVLRKKRDRTGGKECSNTFIDDKGYERCATTKLYVHRIICRKFWGYFPADWHVHHIDFDKRNNQPENLIAMPGFFHREIHDEMRKTGFRFSRREIADRLRAAGLRRQKRKRLPKKER